MTITANGTVHGKPIELDKDLGIADGQAVVVQVRIVPEQRNWADGILRTAGALADVPEWDAAMEEIYQARNRDRRPGTHSSN